MPRDLAAAWGTEMSYEIEEVRDLAPVWNEVAELFAELHEFHVPFGEPPLVRDWQRILRSHFASAQERLTLLGRVDGTVVGLMNARIQRNDGLYEDRYGFIENAFIKEEHRGSGLAQAMLQRTEHWCRGRGIDLLRLSVNAENATAVHFWEKTGFRPMLHTMTKSLSEAAR